MRKLIFILAVLACPPAYSNEIYITQSGNEFSATIVQKGEDNLIEGLDGTGTLTGNLNSLEINQGYEGNNYVELAINGDGNEIIVGQEKILTDGASGITWTDDTNSYGYHHAEVSISGDSNVAQIVQRNNNTSTSGHTSRIRVVNGDNNDVRTLQTGSGSTNGHDSLVTANNGRNGNTVDIFQNSDTADHKSVVSIYSNDNLIDIDQTGSSQNKAYVLISTHNTGAVDFSLSQNGGDTYGNPDTGSYATISCGNTYGCAVSVTQ